MNDQSLLTVVFCTWLFCGSRGSKERGVLPWRQASSEIGAGLSIAAGVWRAPSFGGPSEGGVLLWCYLSGLQTVFRWFGLLFGLIFGRMASSLRAGF